MEMERLWEHRIAGFLCWPEEPHKSLLTTSIPAYNADGVDLPFEEDKSVQDGKVALCRETRRPFFSFVRTTEGSSLLTTIRALKRLFPTEDERTILLYSEGELDVEEVNNPTHSPSEKEDSAASALRSSNPPVIGSEIDDFCYVACLAQGNASTGDRENDLLVDIAGSHKGLPQGQRDPLTITISKKGEYCPMSPVMQLSDPR
jgi:hypothetical protein